LRGTTYCVLSYFFGRQKERHFFGADKVRISSRATAGTRQGRNAVKQAKPCQSEHVDRLIYGSGSAIILASYHASVFDFLKPLYSKAFRKFLALIHDSGTLNEVICPILFAAGRKFLRGDFKDPETNKPA
jgi:hypothetical protein